MATDLTPMMGTIKLIFVDIPAGVAVEETIDMTKPFHDFMALLSRMSGSVHKQVQGLVDRYELKESGLNLSEGCWWYRIVKITSAEDQEADQTLPKHTKGEWGRLATLSAYDHMRKVELAAGLPLDEGWVEVQHDLQKKRDESTAVKAREQDKDWRSSIGCTQENPQDNNVGHTSTSASLTNTSNTSLQLRGAEDAVENGVKGPKHAKSDSVGSCSSTEQVKQLLEEYAAQAHPLVIEWPRPPRCNLIHLNENYVAENAGSRDHHPILFASFGKDEQYSEGLPSYTPRPGPFPAQIGKPPSAAHCAYEIRNDIEYHPESPTMEDAYIRPAESHNLHDQRYHGNSVPQSKASVARVEPRQMSISLLNQNMPYNMGGDLFAPTSNSMQSAPAHIQNFAQAPWTEVGGTLGCQQPGQRFSSQETYRSHSSGNAPYQPASYVGSSSYGQGDQHSGYQYQSQPSLRSASGPENHRSRSSGNAPYQSASYLGSGSYDQGDQQSGHQYQSQPLLRSASGPMRLQQYHAPLLSQFGHQSATRLPSYPLPPQEVMPDHSSLGTSNYQYGYGGPRSGSLPTGPHFNFDAMKESEILSLTAQSQQAYDLYQPTPEPSHQPTPNQYSNSFNAMKEGEILSMTARSQQAYGSYQPSLEPSRQATPNQYSRSYSATSSSHPSSTTASRQSSRVLLPGFNYSRRGTPAPTYATTNAFSHSFNALSRELGPTWSSHGIARDPALGANHDLFLQTQGQHGNDTTRVAGPAIGLPRGKKSYPKLVALHGQFHSQPRPGKQPLHGEFSPPKPRMEGKTAVNVLNRYNRAGSTQSRDPEPATTGGVMEHAPPGAPSVSGVKVAFPIQQHNGSARRESAAQISDSPSGTSTTSNFSDDFVVNDSGKSNLKKSRKTVKNAKQKANAKARKLRALSRMRGAVETDARVTRRSSGRIEVEVEPEVEEEEDADAEEDTPVEGQSMMNEG